MNIRTQSALLAAIVCIAMGLAMLLRRQRPRSVTLFGVFALSVGVYYLAAFCERIVSAHGSLGRITLSATILLGSLIPAAALAFYVEFLNCAARVARFARQLAFFSAFIGLAVALSPLSQLQWARVAAGSWILAALGFSVWLLIARSRESSSRVDRLRSLYLAVGSAAAIIFTGLELLGGFGLPVPALGTIVATFNLYFLSQTLLRLRLMDLHELLGKIASLVVLAAILALLFVLLTFWVAGNTGLYLFNTVVATLVMLILLEPLTTWVNDRVTAIAFRQRFAFLEHGRGILKRAAGAIEVADATAIVLDGLNETRRVTHASVYLLSEDRPGFQLADSRGPAPAAFVDLGLARALLLRSERAQLVETVERRIAALRQQPMEARRQRDELKRLGSVKASMDLMKAGITVPLLGTDRALGFLNLFDERVPEAFASDEIALILEMAELLARVIENSSLYDKMRERDRLAALGEMAAGLAHEIRNPLGGIKGAAQFLDPRKRDGEEQEFVAIISEEVNRLNGVVTAFLDYSRPLKQTFGPTDLNEVITRTIRLIANDVPSHLKLISHLAPDLPKVSGDAEQLKQVFINLVQNAIQALGSQPGTITVSTSLVERFLNLRAADAIAVVVSDDGPGIPAEQQPNIFVPFFTTKLKGTGLGLAISQRIVRNHSGTIAVQSPADGGTAFVIRIPALGNRSIAQAALEPSTLDLTPFPGAANPRPPRRKKTSG